MRKLLLCLICTALIANATASFGKERKPYAIHGGFLTHPLFVVYDGPLLSRASTAVLITANTATIATIDGQRVDNNLGPIGVSNVAQFMPGKHVIGVGYLDTRLHSTSYKEVTFDAESGHVYLADATADAKNTWTHGIQGNWNSGITDITAELDEQDNHGIDQAFKSGNRFIRLSDLSAGGKKWLQNRIP